MSELILEIVRRKVESSKVRLVSSAKGGEWHSPCPKCGGNDRFHVWPNQDGGATVQQAGVSGTFWCRKCEAAGDVIDLLQLCDGLDYKAACKELRIELTEFSRGFRPLKQPKRTDSGWTPKQWKTRSEKWRAQATKLAVFAHERILASIMPLAYLSRRGLPLEAVMRYRLGYLEGEDKTGTCLYRARSAFDLPDKVNRDGTKIHRQALWIPRGLTIPLWSGDEVHRIRLRRRKEDLPAGSAKYLLLEGSGQAPMILPPEGVPDALAWASAQALHPSTAAMSTWVVVEAELDACAVHHACRGRVGVMASLTNVGKPDAAAHRLLERAKLILVALDFDAPDSKGNRAGYKGWLWWRQTYAVAARWPVPHGKDPGEAFSLGVDLAEWIRAAMPEVGRLGQSGSGLSVLEGAAAVGESTSLTDGDSRDAASGGAVRWTHATADTPHDAARLPDGFPFSLDYLRCAYADKVVSDALLIPCPLSEKPWWWVKYGQCRECAGNSLCLVEFVTSPAMRAPLEDAV